MNSSVRHQEVGDDESSASRSGPIVGRAGRRRRCPTRLQQRLREQPKLFPQRLEYTVNRIALLLDSQELHRARTSGRSNLALDGWQIFADHPLLGVGTGGFAAVRIERSDRTGTRGFANKKLAAHSAWIKALAENGLFGLMAIGSSDEARFYPGMGTLFLDLLADVISTNLSAAEPREQRRSA